jgi:hypothetical protein
VDTSALVDVGILVKDTNDITLVGADNASSSDDGDVTYLVIINTFDVDGPMCRCRNDTHVNTSQTTVCTAVDKRITKLTLLVFGDGVCDYASVN